MKISNITVDIKENDLFGLVNEVVCDFAKIDGLSIHSLLVQENIFIEGTFKHKIKFKFSIKLSLKKLENNILAFNIDMIKCMNIKIASFIIKGIFKVFFKTYKNIGIYMEDNLLFIDLNLLSPLIPFVNFKLEKLELCNGYIITKISDMIYDSKKEAVNFDDMINGASSGDESKDDSKDENKEEEVLQLEEKITEDFKENNACAAIHKVSDGYTTIRGTAEEVIEAKCNGISQYALFIPDLVALIIRLFKDKRVSKKDKLIAGIMLTYVAVPIDIIPENIPVLGKIDDIIILFIGLDYLLNKIDNNIVMENWEGDEDIIKLVAQGVEHISNLSAGGKIKKFLGLLDKM
ncbi:YkvA family protein [Oceanirhabdus sp. W0125-5]|uniref:YkvA family protein n=1 Tax=Oceanirhabdus sp. W0125-5 TaxID=2999116 RepID=UPI0022F2F608|nr:DUF1232 domain-containing protein [Oceanirhabdus sp. W0125-5]WBW98688.1 DUF1232 domain-containing protein [Oceanirhabdus sp. W0125-5]